MQDFEKLNAFYLGKEYDLEAGELRPELLLYDAKDLTTHAVCVGMTGSGKTGLCLALLEEAAIDGIPAIAIDPKGDLGNLFLTFPNLEASDFRPWVDPAEATRQGLAPDQFAAQTAKMWREGLASWGQDGQRISRFRSSVDAAIYTPGSNAGLPITVLRSFNAPPAAVIQDSDAFRERISSAVSGLLALMGIEADPIRSREHILLSNLLDQSWREGKDLDMPGLIRAIQSPPFDKVGFMDLETFYPSGDRFELAMSLNNLLASPGFSSWMQGEPLDIGRMLYTPEGRPRLSILSIAHLSDAERMFFVTILLNELVTWMRAQPGTSSLRALLYMDEVFGYLPPTANPPTKTPMLTLLKQARAFGLGVVLATQNPVDLDYKALSNAGTWFLGRLQTERDKARVLDGLEGASATSGANFDRSKIEAILAGLGSRVFLMNNVHDDEPVIFHTRWVMSYLRGPMTREHISELMADKKAAESAGQSDAGKKTKTQQPVAGGSKERPVVPPNVPECFLPWAGSGDGRLVYRPGLIGTARLHFVNSRAGVDLWQTATLLVPIDKKVPNSVWSKAKELEAEEPELETAPDPSGEYANLPSAMTQAKKYKTWSTALKNHLYRERSLKLYYCPALKMTSEPEESEGDFRVRVGQMLNEKRDLQVEKLRKRFTPKLARVQEQIRKALQRVEREKSQAKQQTLKTALSFGTTVLGALFGRKMTSSTNVTRAASSLRSAGRIASERGDIGRAEESVESLQKKMADLEAEFQEEVEELEDSMTPDGLEIEEKPIRTRKSDLAVQNVALVWTPWEVDSAGIAEEAY